MPSRPPAQPISEAITHSKSELARAQRELARFREAHAGGEFELAEDAWLAFLSALEKTWTKLMRYREHPGGSVSAWIREVRQFQRDDPLLRYLGSARDADHHAMDRVIVRRQERVRESVGPRPPGGQLAGEYIEAYIIDGQGRVVRDDRHPIWHTVEAECLVLTPARDRGGNQVPLPSTHHCMPIPEALRTDPEFVGGEGLAFYAWALGELEERLAASAATAQS